MITVDDILALTGDQLKQVLAEINANWKGATMKVYIVQDNDGKILETFAFEEHAHQYVNSTLAPSLHIIQKTVWWSYLKPSDHLPEPGGRQTP